MGQSDKLWSVERYIALVQGQPTLSLEEELSLARRYQAHGDLQAKQALLRANLRQVIPLARRYGRYGVGMAELIAQGNLALVGALDRFDPERGLRFATYAGHWVRAEMLAIALRQRSMVGGGKGPLRAKYVFQLRRAYQAVIAQVGDPGLAAAEIAQRFGNSPSQVQEILARIDGSDLSMEAQAGEDSEGASLRERLSTDVLGPDETVAAGQERERLAAAVRWATRDLDERERWIVENRLMAEKEDRWSLREIGAHFGVSRERARQLERELKFKLQRRLTRFAPAGTALAAA